MRKDGWIVPTRDGKLKRAVVKEELVALTGNAVAAMALNQFLYWSERTKDFDKFIEEERERNPEAAIGLTHGWIYKSMEELHDELMLASVSVSTLRRRVQGLVDKLWLDRRCNPRYGWDRTWQYRPNILRVQVDLFVLGYVLEGYPLQFDDSFIQRAGSIFHGERWKLQGEGALPEITTDITPEEKEKEEKEISFDDLKGHSQSISSQPEAPISKGFEPSVADPSQESPDVEELARQLAPPIDWVWDYDKATNKTLIHAAKALLIKCKDGKIDDVLEALDTYLDKNGQWARENIDSPMGLITLVARQYQKMQGQAERQATTRSAWAEDIEASRQAWAKRQVHTEERDPWWDGKLRELQGQMMKGAFDTWLKPTRLLSREGGRIVVGVQNSYAKDWIENRLRGVIERAVAADGIRVVEFEIAP